jgi:chromosome partitioning protein
VLPQDIRKKTLAAITAANEAYVTVICLLKGGTAKTTSAWFIALYYATELRVPTLLIDADPSSQSAYDWYKVAKAEGWHIPPTLTVVRHPFEDLAEHIRDKRRDYGAIIVDVGGDSAQLFHEAVTEANRVIMPVAPTRIERRRIAATLKEAARAAALNPRPVTAHLVMVKADSRTSLPARTEHELTQPDDGTEPLPLARTKIHAWLHYMEAFGEIPTELGEYTALIEELETDHHDEHDQHDDEEELADA